MRRARALGIAIAPRPRVFLLSPASTAGQRAKILLRDEATFDLARRIRSPRGAPIGETFSFLSGLYFRGKVAYAERFGVAPRGRASSLVITATWGLVSPRTRVTIRDLREFADVDIAKSDPRFCAPLERDAGALARRLPNADVVLLGSIASDKYVALLGEIFGERLLFPIDFVGRGDLSRGGLLLRAVTAGEELPYASVLGAVRRGARPPRLTPIRR